MDGLLTWAALMQIRIRHRLQFEEIRVDAHESFACRQFHLPRFPFQWHYHPEIELTLIVAGRGRRFVGDSVEDFRDGDLCLLGAQLPHTWFSTANAPRGVRSVVVQFLPDLWRADLPELRRWRALFARARVGLCFRGPTRRAVAQRMRQMVRTPTGSWHRWHLLNEALGILADSRDVAPLASTGYQYAADTHTDRQLGRVLQFIDQHRREGLTQSAVAAALGMSPAAFSRFFKRATGQTFVAYVNARRLREACRALLETDQPITEIAYAVGFNNLSHFHQQFRQLVGTSPREYRRASPAA
jgi:AraC-like DNA-binding protein/mannose-6-phosphate isomerase-like protein (cupin superfamily)